VQFPRGVTASHIGRVQLITPLLPRALVNLPSKALTPQLLNMCGFHLLQPRWPLASLALVCFHPNLLPLVVERTPRFHHASSRRLSSIVRIFDKRSDFVIKRKALQLRIEDPSGRLEATEWLATSHCPRLLRRIYAGKTCGEARKLARTQVCEGC